MTQFDPISHLNAAREAAWGGDHLLAIALCTEALDANQLSPAARLDFYDTRAESHIAQGRLDLAAEDAAAMIAIADGEESPAYRAQALNRQALVQMRGGDLETAVATAHAAMQAAEECGDKPLLAESCFRLSEAQGRAGDTDPSIANAERAIRTFHELGDLIGEGRSHWALALAYVKLRKSEEISRALHSALALARQAGDQYCIGNALNVLTFTEADIASNLKRLDEARHAFDSAGYLERQATVTGNLALTYDRLGLLPRARRLQMEAAEISRRTRSRIGLAYALGNLADIEISLGNTAAARQLLLETEELSTTLSDPLIAAGIFVIQGQIALLEQDIAGAVSHFQEAVAFSRSTNDISNQITALVYLGRAYLAHGDPANAVLATAEAANRHRAMGLAVLDAYPSQDLWWWHSRALLANGQSDEATFALKMAYRFLLEGIATMSDEGLRRNYLNKIERNRDIIAGWLDYSRHQDLPPEKQFAHLAGETSLSEPFQRLVDSGLRLNELRTAAELHEFLIEEATELTGAERVLLILEGNSGHELAGEQLPKGEAAGDLLPAVAYLLDQARRSRAVQLEKTEGFAPGSISRITAPLIAQNKVLGYLYADLSAPYGSLGEADRDMLGLLAGQAAVALDNARWSEGLEQQVLERTAQLNERVGELAILNSVGEAMAHSLDVSTVAGIVGDKVRDIFRAECVDIILFDPQAKLLHFAYSYDEGEGGYIDENDPIPLGRGLTSIVIESRKPLNLGSLQEAVAHGAHFPAEEEGAWSGVYTESYLGVPILVSDKILGLVALQSYRKEAYDDDDVRLLQTLSANMGVAIENARLFEAEQQRVGELAILNSVGEAMAQTLDVKTVTRIVGDKVRDIFQAEVVAITLLNAQTNMLHNTFTYDVGEGGYIDNQEPFPLGAGLTSKVISSRQPLNLGTLQETIDHGAYFAPEQEGESGIFTESWLGVPILVSERVLGIVGLASYSQHAFDDDHVRLLQTLSANMGVAIENARLFEAEQQRVAELAIINSVQQGLATELDFQGIIDLVGDKLREVFAARALGIDWIDPQNNRLHYLYAYENNERLQLPSVAMAGEGWYADMIRTRQPVIFNTAADYEAANVRTMPGTDAGKSLIMVPIISSDRVLGAITIENHEREYAYGAADLRLLSTIAASLGTALENARLFDETQRLLKETEQRAEELAIINSVQEGLASKLDMQAIYDLVGEKIRDMFNSPSTGISSFDHDKQLSRIEYTFEDGQRVVDDELLPFNSMNRHLISTRQPV